MKNINETRYPNIKDAVAFRIAFAPLLYTYDNAKYSDLFRCVCSQCGMEEQMIDFLAPKSNCKNRDGAILDIYRYGVSIEVHDLLIEKFDITENDFRPVRNKTGDVVFYQITPVHILPPIGNVNRIKMLKPCRKCGASQYRIKEYTNENGWPYYYISKQAYAGISDLCETSEKFQMYIPYYIVSKEVYNFLTAQYPRMIFYPVFLKDK